MGARRTIFLVTILFIAEVIIGVICSHASAKEITVDDDSEADFRSIQEAVTNSYSGDVILVYPGNYNESVDVTKENISILSESEDPEDTLIRALNVSSNNTTVSGFSIEEVLTLREYNGDSNHYNYPVEDCTIKNNILKLGINADECYNSTIEKNVILNSGISVSSSDDAVISNFRIADNLIVNGEINVYLGPNNSVLLNNTILKGRIVLIQCDGHKILENYVSNSRGAISGASGIVIYESNFNEIENNTVVNCSEGIRINSVSSIISNNTLTNNNQGIVVGSSLGQNSFSNNSFSNNTISNSNIGIFLGGSSVVGIPAGGDSYLNNNISNNNIGIFLECDSSSNLVANNKIELNKQFGVYIEGVNYEVPYNVTDWFYNNIFNNTVNFFNNIGNYKSNYYITKATNNSAKKISATLNTTKTSGTNIVCGPYLGGNYWEKPDGTGFSQNCVDSDGDGIGDLPYNISENETDYLPLVSVSRSQESITPFANFSTNITHTLVPLSIQFTDLSQNVVAWSWDFDNNGIPDSTSQNPVHVYTSLGTYIVNLTASNGKDTSSKTQEIIVQEAKIPPVANFSTNVTGGQVPLSVQFTDLSKNATAIIWDFKNDGIPDSTERTPVYVYTYPGIYTVNLTVDNTKGTASKLSTIITFPAQRIDGELILTEYQITTNESSQFSPAIYKDRIVWQDNRNGNLDIYMYNLSTHKETQITTNGSVQYNPDIDGDNIVWNDRRNENRSRDIYMYNISTSTETQIITNKSDKWLPTVYKDKIAWIDYRNGKADVYLYNLFTSSEIQITTDKSDGKYDPDIYDDRVVWRDYRNGFENSDIYMYNLSTSIETQITPTESEQHQQVIYGNIVVWQDERNGNSDIYMYDIYTSRETQITTSKSNQINPAFYEDRILWADDRNENWDIYMYNLSTKKETQITTNDSNQDWPAIYGNRIAWVDYRNGFENSDIYMCTISKEETESEKLVADFSGFPNSGTAPLKVLFTDNRTGAPTSWLWDFGDGINSKHAMNATHTFTKPGIYNVTLNVTNTDGSSSIIRPGYVTVISE